eukprot:2926300-Heterocapsa_arctica.AAC.1
MSLPRWAVARSSVTSAHFILRRLRLLQVARFTLRINFMNSFTYTRHFARNPALLAPGHRCRPYLA